MSFENILLCLNDWAMQNKILLSNELLFFRHGRGKRWFSLKNFVMHLFYIFYSKTQTLSKNNQGFPGWPRGHCSRGALPPAELLRAAYSRHIRQGGLRPPQRLSTCWDLMDRNSLSLTAWASSTDTC
jgi:hypothetical protein